MSTTNSFHLKSLLRNKRPKTTQNFIGISFLLFLMAALFPNSSFCQQNLITNGDFESGGNGTGFVENSSAYTEVPTPFSGTTVPGDYGFTTNPQLLNTVNFIAGGDHTTGSGKMMVVDGSTTAPRSFWLVGSLGGGICKDGLNPWIIGETYTFSYWLKSVSTIGTPASIRVFIGGVSDVSPAIAPVTATSEWQKITYSFKVTDPESCVTIELFSTNTSDVGNDFAVDDFSLIAPPVALSLSYTSTSPLCPDSSNGTITAVGVGGSFPYSSYTLTGTGISPITTTNGIFTGLAAGTYSVSIKDEGNNTAKKDIILTNPTDLTVSSNVTICKGSSTNLSVSGSSAQYTWTASPADPTLNNIHSSTPTVKPTQTTTYTVNSSPVSDNTPNLVVNGDFESGNKEFITDYDYRITASDSQKGYGVVKNPKNWFGPFVESNDHTTGTGYLLVADGSTFNSGNDKIWQQTIGVVPNQDYTFSYWVQTVANNNLADMDVKINGTSVGRDFAPSTLGKWEQRKYVWNSGVNTTAIIAMYDKKTISDGNDFALDDIAFRINTTCNLSKSVVVTVTSPIQPTFNTIVTAYCTGSTIPALPTTSTNNIIGTWSPAIDNTKTTEYTFTPNTGQCTATPNPKITIEVSTSITPQFNPIASICAGGTLSPLPTTSLNNITGTWSPALNNTVETKYTFTPTAGQCGVPTDLTITVNPNITPLFNTVNPICFGENLSDLPTTSNNSITGTWSPQLDNTKTTEYTFTPSVGQCATTTTKTITVNNSSVVINASCIDTDYTLEAITSGNNITYKWYKGATVLDETSNKLIVKSADTYKVEVNSTGCPGEAIENVTSFYCDIPKGVSPNNDNKNDTFDLSDYSVYKLEIFNRYGVKVYSKSNYKKEWNGVTDSGQELPDATYYYVVEFESGKSKTGWVYLNRQN